MEFFGVLLAFGVFVSLVAPWVALAKIRDLRSSYEREMAKLREKVATLEDAELNRHIQEVLAKKAAATEAATPAAKTPVAAQPLTQARVSVESMRPMSAPPAATPTHSAPISAAPAPPAKAIAPPAVSAPKVEVAPRPIAPPPIVEQQDAPPIFQSTAHEARAAEQASHGNDFEFRLGVNWLNKIGVAMLVIGAALLMKLYIVSMGPWGKALGGAALGAAMLVGGVLLEKRERYRLLGRGLIGGGWAMLFFMSFALEHISATRIITSEVADLILMLATAAAMTAHSLRYRSQTVTGLSLLLAFVTVSISQQTAFSLTAGVILTLSVIVLSHRMEWRWLELCGMLAAFGNQWIWLDHVCCAYARPLEHATFVLSSAVIAFYWLAYKASYLWRKEGSPEEAMMAGFFSAATTGMALILCFQQMSDASSERVFALLVTAGAAESAAACVAWRRRANQRMLSPTLATAMLFAAAPYYWGNIGLIVVWALMAEALLALGVVLRERGFWRLGATAGSLAAIAGMHGVVDDAAQAWKLYPMATLFALNHTVLRRWRKRVVEVGEDFCLRGFVALAMALTICAACVGQGRGWSGVAMVLASAVAMLFGWLAKDECVRGAGEALATIGGVFALIVGSQAPYAAWGAPAYASAMLIPAALLLALSAMPRSPDEKLQEFGLWRAHMGIGLLLICVYLWLQTNGWLTAPLLALLGVIVFEIGVRTASAERRWMGWLLLLISFVRVCVFNDQMFPGVDDKLWLACATLPTALAWMWTQRRCEALTDLQPESRMRMDAFSGVMWAGSLVVTVGYELPDRRAAAAWAVMSAAMLALGWLRKRALPLAKCNAISWLALAAALYGYFENNAYPTTKAADALWRPEALTCAILLAALGLACPLAHAERRGEATWAQGLVEWTMRNLFFAPLAVLLLLITQIEGGMLTLLLIAVSLAVFVAALVMRVRLFRRTGLTMLLGCVVKIGLIDVWSYEAGIRNFTLMAMGAALIAVSFLYARYKEILLRYL